MIIMYCDGVVRKQESWITGLLLAQPSITVDGDTLVVSDSTNSMTLHRT